MKSRKYTIEEVRKIIEEKGYILVSEIYINVDEKLIIKDRLNYFYLISLYNIRKNHPDRFSKYNPYTIQNIKLWCKLNNKPFELISELYEGNKINLKWQCLEEECGEIFETTWNSILRKEGCGYCSNPSKKVGISNCLATKRPDLAKEWHPTLNILTPYDVTCFNNTNVWWQCSKDQRHYWDSTPNNRQTQGCPYCAHKFPSEDYNLLFIHPEICEEWDYEKNDKRPEEYTPNSNIKVWWKCKICNYRWPTSISNRSREKGSGCPVCAESKGEKRISEYYSSIKVVSEAQKMFDGLIGLGGGLLSYDFYLPHYNLLVEYQGEQHAEYRKGLHKSKKDFKKQQEHDRRKKEYAQQNKYNFLEIWYYDFDNIEKILDDYLKELSEKDSSFPVV